MHGLMSIAYIYSHEYYSSKNIRESRNQFFSKNWIQVSWQPSVAVSGEEPVSTNWLQSTSKWFNIFKKLQNWKNLVSTLVHIQLAIKNVFFPYYFIWNAEAATGGVL